jgi:hypothetical protein
MANIGNKANRSLIVCVVFSEQFGQAFINRVAICQQERE